MVVIKYGFTRMHILLTYIAHLFTCKSTKSVVVFTLITAVIKSEWAIIEASTMSGRHIRNPLIRTVYSRMLEDERQRNEDHSYWYKVDTSLSEETCSKFIQSTEDEETVEFINESSDKSDWVFTQIYHLFAKSVLSWFMTNTSINGLLQRGSMFVLSTQQFRTLMQIPHDFKYEKLLDLGAGDGEVTKRLASHFTEVFATETSSTMVWRLKEKGYTVFNIDEWQSQQYDVISALNLIDRCDKPMTLLREIHKALKPGTGRLLLAVVIPYKPYVEFGRSDHKPTEYLHIEGKTFEEQVTSLVTAVFEPAGFSLQSFTRVPYLCEGDLEHSFYTLDDAVFALTPV